MSQAKLQTAQEALKPTKARLRAALAALKLSEENRQHDRQVRTGRAFLHARLS